MERKVGERFTFKDVTLEVEEIHGNCCLGCYFRDLIYCNMEQYCDNPSVRKTIGLCSIYSREDGKSVIFTKIEE